MLQSSAYIYASPSSGEAYRDRQLTPNFELWVEMVCVPTCFHTRIREIATTEIYYNTVEVAGVEIILQGTNSFFLPILAKIINVFFYVVIESQNIRWLRLLEASSQGAQRRSLIFISFGKNCFFFVFLKKHHQACERRVPARKRPDGRPKRDGRGRCSLTAHYIYI